ncbi:hypothetical protein BGZ97_001035 [Linnemannia gamsii]|uniref:Uncharacterized protein n=1 Tax=Linnemannia gamsii TaxID=64522 RepID=A0A9P6UJQ5_9FUNG|nr:hypothetical protein BGZ97_001035 [Linnemannia gamsii]
MALPYVYNPLEDSEFDETDGEKGVDTDNDEEEQDETDNEEEEQYETNNGEEEQEQDKEEQEQGEVEQEQEQGEEEWDDNEQDEFEDAEEHSNADDQHVGTLTSIHKSSDNDPSLEEDKDVTRSPAAAALVRIGIRNGKRPLRAIKDLQTTPGSSENIHRSTISTLNGRPNTQLPCPTQPALERQPNRFTEPSPFQAPARPVSQPSAASQRPSSSATPNAL